MNSMQSANNKYNLRLGTVYLTISSFVFMISGYILNIWLGKYLGPAFYGVYGVIISLMNAFTVMQTSGLPQATSKFIAEDENSANAVLKTSIIVQLASTAIISLFFYIFARNIAAAFNDLSLTPYFRLTAFVFPAYGLFALYTGYHNGHHDFKKQAIMYTIYSVVKAVSIILLVLFFGIYGAVIGFIVSPAVSLIYGFVWPKSGPGFPYKKLIMFSLPLIGYAIVSTFQTSIDLFFVKRLVPDHAAAGLYTAAQNIARIPFYIMGAFALVVFPAVSKAVKQNDEKVKQLIENFLRYALMLILPLSVLIMGTPSAIIKLLYSSSYLPAQTSLILLIIGSGLFTLFGILANILNGSGRPGLAVTYSLAGTIVIYVLCQVLVPKYGLAGAAMATTAGCLVSMTMALASVVYYFKISINLFSLFKIFAATFLLYLFIKLVHTSTLMLPLLYLFVLILYTTFLYLIKELNSSDLKLVKAFIPSWLANYLPN